MWPTFKRRDSAPLDHFTIAEAAELLDIDREEMGDKIMCSDVTIVFVKRPRRNPNAVGYISPDDVEKLAGA